MLNFNNKITRRIKRNPDGAFTIETQVEQARNDNLCDCCARRFDCAIGKLAMSDTFAQIKVRHCERFVPLIAFRPPLIGLETTFNTMRLGGAWLDRLQKDDLAALYDSVADKIIGHARVRKVFHGDYDDILKCHAKYNHVAIHDKPDNPVEHVNVVLRKSYGQFMNKPELKLQAIYLSRVDDAEIE